MTTSQPEAQTIQARRVLVPVANPATAPGLIEMAWKLSSGQGGRLQALYVTLSGTEPDDDTLNAITAIVENATQSGIPIELVTRTAPSVARGILDAALEHGATLMVLGFQAPARSKVVLGPVVESVARTTPCDLVVYRSSSYSSDLEDIERVILPLDGSDNSKVAARLGLMLAETYHAQPTAIYVQTGATLPSWFGMARIEASLAGLGDSRQVMRQVVRANDVVGGILARCDRSDLIVLGFSEQSSLDRWIFGNVARRMLEQAPGPVILAKRAIQEGLTPSQQMTRRWVTRFSPTLTPSERSDIIRQASELSQPGINFTVLMVLSSLLAAFGLLQSSAAVIIGAMLVAPLMSPLMSFSVGLILGNLRLMRTALVTVLIGVLIGLVMATVSGVIVPLDTATPEMLARGRPSLLDMGVALAAGAAGAYAMARKDIPAALVGVAIAAALVPPLCTVGLALAFRDTSLASGAVLLFLTNIVSISLAGSAVFAWLGLSPSREHYTRTQVLVSLLILLLLALPLASTLADVIRVERQTNAAQDVLQQQFHGADIIDVRLNGNRVTATIRSPEMITQQDVQAAERTLQRDLGPHVTLEITYWQSITPSG
jgi:uncharacterized hydrophobic protein (TIGR00271 family)